MFRLPSVYCAPEPEAEFFSPLRFYAAFPSSGMWSLLLAPRVRLFFFFFFFIIYSTISAFISLDRIDPSALNWDWGGGVLNIPAGFTAGMFMALNSPSLCPIGRRSPAGGLRHYLLLPACYFFKDEIKSNLGCCFRSFLFLFFFDREPAARRLWNLEPDEPLFLHTGKHSKCNSSG
ncbi:hypothetical protein BS47DRAFT_839706 [Hydnum rufescens UP504]|uniref:Transmembrane protein n=1 Tax=Hydnum rufescens UP504 TaxID=1448309 RepID=A0A9P6B0I3_9AGAM|nr:hypothetical protein BS47DRAFT_839706 [Hydnum rufescens UP504]